MNRERCVCAGTCVCNGRVLDCKRMEVCQFVTIQTDPGIMLSEKREKDTHCMTSRTREILENERTHAHRIKPGCPGDGAKWAQRVKRLIE